jgi:hypothetical protein
MPTFSDLPARISPMLDVILCGHDHLGCLTLREQAFDSFGDLCLFFGSVESLPWKWAEVTGNRGTRHYSAAFLRWRVPGPILILSLN